MRTRQEIRDEMLDFANPFDTNAKTTNEWRFQRLLLEALFDIRDLLEKK